MSAGRVDRPARTPWRYLGSRGPGASLAYLVTTVPIGLAMLVVLGTTLLIGGLTVVAGRRTGRPGRNPCPGWASGRRGAARACGWCSARPASGMSLAERLRAGAAPGVVAARSATRSWCPSCSGRSTRWSSLFAVTVPVVLLLAPLAVARRPDGGRRLERRHHRRVLARGGRRRRGTAPRRRTSSGWSPSAQAALARLLLDPRDAELVASGRRPAPVAGRPGRRVRDRAPADRARPPRRRAAAAGGADHDARQRRARGRRGPRARPGPCGAPAGRGGARRAARRPSAASTRGCSPTTGWRPRSTRSPTAPPSRSRSTSAWPSGCPAPVEAAAYFVVSEALTNVARHAGARRARGARRGARATRFVLTVHDDGVGGAGRPRRGHAASPGSPYRLDALGGDAAGDQPAGRADRGADGGPCARLRIVLAEDAALLREGLVGILERAGHEVVAAVAGRRRPAGVRRPRAARPGRHRHPDAADPHRRGTARGGRGSAPSTRRSRSWCCRRTSPRRTSPELLDSRPGRRRRLPAQGPGRPRPRVPRQPRPGRRRRDRRRPQVVRQLLGRRRDDGPLATLTEREREVLALMAEGRTNGSIAERAGGQRGGRAQARRQHLRQARLEPGTDRRVSAVLAYLRGSSTA